MPRLSTALVVLATALGAVAQDKPAGVDDQTILNYALTLEHLEAAFYTEGLQKLNANDFAAGGEQHALFEQIRNHEQAHVALLQSVLGDKATKACTYKFPYTDVQSFKALAQVLEGVGVSAYLGAAQYISDPAYLTAAASILTIEARHAAWLAATNGADPFPGPNDTPLGFSQVYSLAAPFITACPDSNPKLPVKAFPALTAVNGTNLKNGQEITFNVPADFKHDGDLFVAFLNGLTPAFVPYKANSSVPITNVNATGTVYAVITSSNKAVTDDTTLAGPAVLTFDPGYPSGVALGSSTGSGSGNPGTNADGTPATGGSNGGGSGNAPGAATTLVQSWTAAAVTAGFAMIALL